MRILSPTIAASLTQIPTTILNKCAKVAKAVHEFFIKISATLINFFSKLNLKGNIRQIKIVSPNDQAAQEPIKPAIHATFKEPQSQEQCQANSKEIECAICLEPMSDNDSEFLECVHRFHTFCLSHWRKISDKCPICRTNC